MSDRARNKKTITFENNINKIKNTDIFIITTPTPINRKNKPN